MALRRLWSQWFEAHREAGCWLANLGLALGGSGALSPAAREPARCPLRAVLPMPQREPVRRGPRP